MPTYTYTFTDAQNQSDTLTVQTTDTPDGGPYSVTSISGTVNGQAITGLDETYAGPDNTIGFTASYLDGVDGNGVSFDTADGDSFNLYSQGGNISLGDANVSDAGVLTNVVFTQEPACYLRGTRIATPAGERTVEALRLGDLVLTHDGAVPIADFALLAGGWSAAALSMIVGARRAGSKARALDLLAAPAYWALQSVAASMAVMQLCTRPHHWDKTAHEPPVSDRIGGAALDEAQEARLRPAA